MKAREPMKNLWIDSHPRRARLIHRFRLDRQFAPIANGVNALIGKAFRVIPLRALSY
jgi:hypothetical protein